MITLTQQASHTGERRIKVYRVARLSTGMTENEIQPGSVAQHVNAKTKWNRKKILGVEGNMRESLWVEITEG